MYLNRENQFKVDTNGGTGTASYAALAKGMYNWSESLSQTVDTTDYYDGTTASDVLVNRRTFSFQCHTMEDTAAQYIWGLRDKTGDDCRTLFQWVQPDGTTETWKVAILNVSCAGGDANAKDGFSFDVARESVVTTTAATE